MRGKSYGQYCGLAKALDRIGDRWTLLIVRELLLGDAAYRELQSALPGVSPNLLSSRLAKLTEAGIVARTDAPPRSKSVRYQLTARGRSLEPVVMELIRWGGRWMWVGPGDDHVDPRWGQLALRALLADPQVTSPQGSVLLVIGDREVVIAIDRSGRTVQSAAGRGTPHASVEGSLPELLAIAAGARSLVDAQVDIVGDLELARAALSCRTAVE